MALKFKLKGSAFLTIFRTGCPCGCRLGNQNNEQCLAETRFGWFL